MMKTNRATTSPGPPPRQRKSSAIAAMSEKWHKQKCSTAIASSQLVQARQPGGQARKRPKDVKLGAFNLLRPFVEHGKRRA